MLTMTLTLAALLPVVAAGGGGAQQPPARAAANPGVTVVEGTIELSSAEAEASALALAARSHRDRLLERGRELAADLAPFWLPAFIVRGETVEWVRRQEQQQPAQILGLETIEHSYSYGIAYRTSVRLGPPAAGAIDDAAVSRLQRGLRRAGKLLLAKFGGIAVGWGLLAFLCSWLDRLSRGYMTWRLRFIASGLGLVLPALVLLV